MANGKLRTVWTGISRKQGKKIEKEAMRVFGDAIMSAGGITMKGKTRGGYAVSVREKDYKRVKKLM